MMALPLATLLMAAAVLAAAEPPEPAAWGTDHVGKSFPEYLSGDECLFCHRETGMTWGRNRHQTTLRLASPDDPAIKRLRKLEGGANLTQQTRYLLGSRHLTRYLKPSGAYGKLDMLTTAFVSPPPLKPTAARQEDSDHDGDVRNAARPHWDGDAFADRCAGCHTTAVDAATRAFSALSLDCFTCHGDVPREHAKQTTTVLLSATNREPRQVVSLCGQCHLRGGRSKSTGLPYPNTFIAGDNLFRDFQVDFTDAAINALPILDRHVFINTRDVAVSGRSHPDCLACHDVHRQSTSKHRKLADAAICSSCHLPGQDHELLRPEFDLPIQDQSRNPVCDD